MRTEKKIYLVIGILIIIAIISGVSYAYWSRTLIQSGENVVTSDCFDVTYEESNTIKLINSYPIYDEEGKKLTPYHLKVRNKCEQEVNYQMNFETTKNTTMKDSYIKMMFQEKEPVLLNTIEETESTIQNGRSAYKLESGMMEPFEEKEYDIRIWMDEGVTAKEEGAMNGTFESKIVFRASHIYHEKILNGTDPVLKEGLIPVEIDEKGEVYKANVDSAWYQYANQKWANAVILEDESIEYQNGETIPESNIESYFVWIPKYRYKLWDLGNYEGLSSINSSKVHDIEIIFGDYDTVDKEGECKTPGVSGSSGNCKEGDYMTHPAFQSFGTKGIWVGKFEVGYKGADSTTGAQQNVYNSDKVEIKPNVYSWRNIQVANAHLNSYNYKREYDSHMMKNTEWGAVAYLQHSIYGSRRLSKSDQDILNTTTGNISGIYNMRGNASEYIMGVLKSNNNNNICAGKNSSNTSGFSGIGCESNENISGISFPSSKYYDLYQYYNSGWQGYYLRILGDATGEMGPFSYQVGSSPLNSWQANAWFIYNGVPWFVRNDYFEFGHSTGFHQAYTYRIILAI